MRTLRHRFINSQSIRGQAARFLIVGGSAMVLDLATYRTMLFLLNVIPVAKGAGFVIGTTYAFFANRAFTFKDKNSTRNQVFGFLGVYFVTCFFNVGINSAMLHLLGFHEIGINVSFAVATACSAAMNFLGMRFFVFNGNTLAAAKVDQASKAR